MLATAFWCSFFVQYWLLTLGVLEPNLGNLASLAFFAMCGVVTGAKPRAKTLTEKKEKSE